MRAIDPIFRETLAGGQSGMKSRVLAFTDGKERNARQARKICAHTATGSVTIRPRGPFRKPEKPKLFIHHIKRKENEDYTVNNRF